MENDNNEYFEKLRYTIESFEFSLENFNTKILWWSKAIGVVGLILLMTVGYVFYSTIIYLMVLGITRIFLFCGWIIGYYYIKKKIIQESNLTLEYRELVDLKLYIADVLLTDAIEIKARGSYSRDRLQEIKALCELLRTQEGIEKATSILKAFDLNLNDIQWMEGSKTGIRIVEENGKEK